VTTNPGGIPEVVRDGVNGYMAEVEDSKTLADKLVDISENDALQKVFTEKSFEQLMNGFSSEVMAKKTLEVYKSILNS